jgi:hypothetical protein
MAFRKKASRILELAPDILVVPECESPEKQAFPPQVQEPRQRIWVGDNVHKGLGVFSYPDFDLVLHELYDPSIRYVVPIRVKGRGENFTLLAVWAMDSATEREQRYIGQVWRAVNKYEELLGFPTLIVGDFNWNAIWDGSPGLCGNLSQTAAFLRSKGIVSLYHRFFEEDFGEESCPTLYLYRKSSRPYHVDYLFASRVFARRLRSFEVGVYKEWKTFSDHMPVVASFEMTAG